MIPPDAFPHPSFAPNRSVVNATVGLWQAANRRQWLDASGTSMQPLIHHGDHLLVDHSPFVPRRGDIVLFRQANGLVAHRIIDVKLPGAMHLVLTKGDNVNWFDRPLAAAGLLGRVVAVSHSGRIIRLDTPWWRAAGFSLAHYTNVAVALYRLFFGYLSPPFATFRQPHVTVALAHTFLRLFLRLTGEPPP